MGKKIKYCIAGAVLLLAGGIFAAAGNQDFKLGRSIEILINIFRDVNMFYVDETDPDKLLQDAAFGLTFRLDPYTEFISADGMEDFEIMTTGKYGGIGSKIRKKGDYIVIAEPYQGYPADKAGLRIGDRLVEVDGTDVVGMASERVSSLLKGDPGTTVVLKVLRLASGKEEIINVTREKITIPGIPFYSMLPGGIGYIKHDDFSDNCSAEMLKAFTELRNTGTLNGLILDYRENGGGILQEAVKILSMFVPKGTEVVSMKGRLPEMSAVYRTENDPVDLETPIAVLTSGGSASAAEIVAGALQDLDRAVLVGQRTYGKGLVQMTRPVGYNSYLKVTTAKYYIPSGRCIQAIDYAQRSEDGSVSYVPDSLVNEFATRNGRKVYDGGGVMPDVVIPNDVSLFTWMTYGRGYVDDFCDEYIRKNPKPVDPATFTVTDRIYGQFTEFMKDKDLDYQSETSLALEALKRKAGQELYYDRIKDDIDAIERRLKEDKDTGLRDNRTHLSELIANELILRHYYLKGVSEYKLSHDNEILEAVEVLRDANRYGGILASQDTARKQ